MSGEMALILSSKGWGKGAVTNTCVIFYLPDKLIATQPLSLRKVSVKSVDIVSEESIMHKHSSVVGGIILILVGLFFLALQFLPEEVTRFLDIGNQWPLIIVALGGIFLVGAILTRLFVR